ncbi:MAG: YncE family protein [Myxococcota bacterium]
MRATVDLNAYEVIALNDDASVAVFDPRFSYGGSRLLAWVRLDAPGEDWLLGQDGRRLFVSTPEAGVVAVVDTTTWALTHRVPVGPHPTRLALSPDGKYAFVSTGANLAALDTDTLKVAATIPVGPGPHAIAFSDDNRVAFVVSRGAAAVSVVDVRTLTRQREVRAGAEPFDVAYSDAAKAAFITDRGNGAITVVDGETLDVATELPAEPGLGAIRFAPDGRMALVLNPGRGLVHVVDAATTQLVSTGNVGDVLGEEPEEIAFTKYLAYVRSRRSEHVLMVPLDQLGMGTLHFADFPAGQAPLARAARMSMAATVVQAPEATAVLVANPADRMIYYYREGLAAPMGGFQTHGREPRAVLVVDRSLREQGPGIYSTTARLGGHGTYDVALFLDSPRVLHCFELEVSPDPALARQVPSVQLTPLEAPRTVTTGEPVRLRVKAADSATSTPRQGLRDVGMLVLLAPGTWQRRLWAHHVGDGVYEGTVNVPTDGYYRVYFQLPSHGLGYHDVPTLGFVAKRDEGDP